MLVDFVNSDSVLKMVKMPYAVLIFISTVIIVPYRSMNQIVAPITVN
jgi:hypothetical protein